MNQNNKFIVILVIGIILGFIATKAFEIPGNASRLVELKKLQQQVEEAKKRFPPIREDIRLISGVVKGIQGTTVTLEVSKANPFDEILSMRTITIADGTKITRIAPKDSSLFQKELAEFQKNAQANESGKPDLLTQPPSLFLESVAPLSAVKPGQQIRVTADENIRNHTAFIAKTVTIIDISASLTAPK